MEKAYVLFRRRGTVNYNTMHLVIATATPADLLPTPGALYLVSCPSFSKDQSQSRSLSFLTRQKTVMN
jgi:hypothetical protein